jgi:hypothetical protein
MPRYSVTIENNKVTDVRQFGNQDDEELGLEWALSELKDTWRHSRSVSATFSLTDKSELKEFLAAVASLLGDDALSAAAKGLLQGGD